MISSLTCLTFAASSERNALWWFLAAGLLAGANVLVRPIGILFVAVYIPYLVWFRGAYCLRNVLLVVILSAMVLPCFWMVRNGALTGAYVLSSIGHIDLYYYRAASVVAQRDQRPLGEVQTELRQIGEKETASLSPPQYLDYMTTNARAVIVAHPKLVLRDWVLGFVRTFQDTGRVTIAKILGDAVPHRPVHYGLRAHLLILYLLVIASILKCYRTPEIWLLVLAVLYFCVLGSGPEAYARFRVPFIPILCVLAGAAWPLDVWRTLKPVEHSDSQPSIQAPVDTPRSGVANEDRRR